MFDYLLYYYLKTLTYNDLFVMNLFITKFIHNKYNILLLLLFIKLYILYNNKQMILIFILNLIKYNKNK